MYGLCERMAILAYCYYWLARIGDCAIIIHWSIGNWPHKTWYQTTFAYSSPCLRVAHTSGTRTRNILYSHLPIFEEGPECYRGMSMAVDGKATLNDSKDRSSGCLRG